MCPVRKACCSKELTEITDFKEDIVMLSNNWRKRIITQQQKIFVIKSAVSDIILWHQVIPLQPSSCWTPNIIRSLLELHRTFYKRWPVPQCERIMLSDEQHPILSSPHVHPFVSEWQLQNKVPVVSSACAFDFTHCNSPTCTTLQTQSCMSFMILKFMEDNTPDVLFITETWLVMTFK